MAQIHFIGGQQHGKAQQIGLEVPDIPAGYMEHSRTYSPPDAEVLADECMIFLVHENIAQNGITARQEAVAAYWAEFEKQNLKA